MTPKIVEQMAADAAFLDAEIAKALKAQRATLVAELNRQAEEQQRRSETWAGLASVAATAKAEAYRHAASLIQGANKTTKED